VLQSGKHDRAFYRDLWKTILSGQTWRGELVNRRKDGSIFYDEHTITPVRSESGAITHFIGIMHDVTGRKHAEEALRASEIRYRRLFESAKDGILILDAKTGIIDDVNPFLVELLGFSREAFLGKEIWELGCFKDIVANQTHLAELQKKGYIRYEDKPLEAADGRRIEVEFVSNVYLVKDREVIQCNVRDVTERKRADARLHDSEALYYSLVEHLPQHIFRKDLTGRFTFGNGSFCRSLGKPLAEILGQTDLDFCPAELAAKYQQDDQRVIQTGQSFEGEEEHRQADGRTIFVNVIKTPLRDAVGKIIGVQGISWDITERKQLEEQFRQAQKMEAIGQLAAGVAHDFNNVLAVIHGNAEMALMFAHQPGESAGECVNQIIAASERAANLTRQLLAFGRK
jgi:two-component system cell cycle sensor histidine kinase/response regulator CckA